MRSFRDDTEDEQFQQAMAPVKAARTALLSFTFMECQRDKRK